METLLGYFAQIREIIKTEPVVAGAFSLYGLAVITWLVKNLPSSIANFFTNQCTTSLTINNAGWNGNEAQFNGFIEWYSNSKWLQWSRKLSLDSKHWSGEQIIISAGYGTHFFMYKYRLFWFTRSKLESSGTDKEKNQIVICTLGRSQKPILNLVEDFRFKPDADKVSIYSFKDDWNHVTSIRKRDLRTVVIEKHAKRKILKDLQYFVENRQWYDDRGMPYKLTYVFHGRPGTGKTSIMSALAAHFNRNICVINLAGMSDSLFAKAMASVPKNSFVVIEDFDSSGAVKSRGGFAAIASAKSSSPGNDDVVSGGVLEAAPAKLKSVEAVTNALEDMNNFSFLTLSGILNTLDGMVRLDDVVVMLSTNHLEKIDPALLRKGRVDHIVEIKHFRHDEVVEYIQLMYPNEEIPKDVYFDEIAGCDIQALFLEHKEDFNGFYDALSKQPYDGRVMGLHLVDKLKALP